MEDLEPITNSDCHQQKTEFGAGPWLESDPGFTQMLKQTRREHLAIFDSVPAMIWYRDRNGRILKVNQYAADSVGSTPCQLVGKNFYDLFPENAEWARQKDLEVIETGHPLRGQLRSYTTFNGLQKWAMVDRIPLRNEEGCITGVIVFALDVTEKKLAEDNLIEANNKIEQANCRLIATAEQAHLLAKKATRSSQAKSELLATSSHDLRTPMNSILGFSEILLDTALDEEQKEYVQTIYQSAKGLLTLINDILEYSKIEAGKLKIEILSCKLAEVVHEVGAMMETAATQKRLKFIIQIDKCLPATFFTDPNRLRQCLINLVGNAIKFTDQGHVAIYVNAEDRAGQRCIRFDVEDTGIGIPKDKQNIIFQSFSQADVSTARKYGGTGLGLTITRKLTGLLGGNVQLKSEIGKGSTFSITLPLFTPQQQAEGRATIGTRMAQRTFESRLKHTGHILLAEKMSPSQLTLMLMLRRAGLEVQFAGSLDQVCQNIKERSFDLILIDAAMELKDPIALMKKLRPQTPPIPVILIDDSDGTEAETCLQAGFVKCLHRPISRDQLYDIIAPYLPEQSRHETHSDVDTAARKDNIASVESVLNQLPELVKGIREVMTRSDIPLLTRFAELFSEIGQTTDHTALHEKASAILECTRHRPVSIQELAERVDQLCRLCDQIHRPAAPEKV